MQTEPYVPQKEILGLIYTTMSETISHLNHQIDSLRLVAPDEIPEKALVSLVEETRKFIIFLKYAGQYIKMSVPQSGIQDEVLRLKLHLLSVLRALSERVRDCDAFAVQDLISEELRDNLTRWKINVLPLLRPSTLRPSIGLTPN